MASNLAFGLGAALIMLLVILTVIPFLKSMMHPFLSDSMNNIIEQFDVGKACRQGGPDGIPCPEGFFCNRGIDASGHSKVDGTCSPIYA